MFPMMHSRLLLICCIVYSVIWLSSAGQHDCGQHETPVECKDQCQTCEYKNGGCAQPAVCIPGCDCIPGFFRNKQNQCIPAAFCPAVCGPNSKPSDCIFCEPTCRNPKPQACAQSCAKGCACDDGFLKDDNGNCIPKNECPIVCGPNSKPSDCVSLCEPTCRNRKPGFCPQACIKGCACNDGFLKDDNGNCVPENKCPSSPQQCPAGEFPVECIDRCQRCEYKNGNCSQILICTPGCNCVPGFLRDSTNKCIPADFCPGTGPGPVQQCPAGEYPVQCVDRCQRCEYKNGNCGQGQACTPGCNCVPGFLRDKTNKCIPANLCPDQCKSDEQHYSDIPDCKNTCENYNNPGAICPQYFAARPGCFCAIGLVKRKDGKCVKPENCFPPGFPCSLEVDAGPCYGYFPRFYFNKKTGQCEKFIYGGCKGNANNFEDKKICEIVCKGPGPGPTQQCPAGEIPVGCIDRCQRCEYKNGNCAQAQVCTPGCNCAPGFLRDSTNKCIPANFCPEQCKSDEQFYPDIPDCKNTCENINNPGAICPQHFPPRPGCFCKKGLVKRKDGKCVKPENCGPPGFPCSLEVDAGPCHGNFPRFYFNKKTGQCEKFIYGGCKGNANNFEDKKICEIICKGPGPGPTQQCPAGEIPVGCIDRCQRCEYKNGNCAQAQVCTPGCNCAPGFLRDSTNKCIPANFCPEQCKSDEQFYPDIPDCKNTCENINNPGAICPQHFPPRPGCFCKKGLVKRKDGKCVKPENCGPPGFPCSLEVDAGPCHGNFPRFYFNKKTGQCEKFIYGGCKGNANNFEDKKICEIICKGPGPGPSQQCPAGEIPVGCIDRCQRCEYKNGNCAQAQVCTPGCNCAPGFLRDSTNKCIPANFCPEQCKSDEQFYPDIPDCKNTCEYINNPGTICPKYFAPRPGCFCKKGLVKRKDGKCVRPENCGPPPGFPCSLEVDAGPCYGYFPRFYFNKKTGQCEKFIYGGCKGNANNFEDKKLCEIVCKGTGPGPAQQCPAGEIPVGCIDRCQRCEFKNGNYCAQIQVCTPGCNCVPGFLRDSTNKCIPANFCPDQCKSDEQFYPDIPDCKNTCEYINNPGTICPKYFAPRPGCFCKKGLVKRKDGKCVRPENCGPPPGSPCSLGVDPGPCNGCLSRFYFNKKTGQCEEFIYGGCEGNANNFKEKKHCEIICKGPPRPQQCPSGEIPGCIDGCQRCEYKNGNCSQIQVCTPGCNCVPGFLRDSTNKCIPADFCPGNNPNKPCLQEKDPGPCRAYIKRFYYNKKTGQCEEFIYGGCEGNANNFEDKKLCEIVCKGPGPTQQCGQYERPVECIDQCQTCEYRNGGCAQPAVCIPGCDCIPGFFRNKQKECIPAAFCPGTGPGPAQQCPAYEYPVPCIDKCQTCEYKNGNCAQTGECTPGCNCVPGFLRDSTKKCIPASRCP